MDPMGRMLLEHTYEAIVDAGIHPKDLRGTRTGVFIGSCFSEFEKVWYYDKLKVRKTNKRTVYRWFTYTQLLI